MIDRIPHLLHYGMFGGHHLSQLNLRCIETWFRVLPSWQKRFWTDANAAMIDSRFFREALKVCPINAHNYFLIWSVWKFGGVAVDCDIEIIRPFDLSPKFFAGFQTLPGFPEVINNAVLGAVPGHPLLRRCLDRLEKLPADYDPVYCGPGILTELLVEMGFAEGREQTIAGVTIYARDRFYPFNHDERHDWMKVTDRTFAVHFWEGSWAKR